MSLCFASDAIENFWLSHHEHSDRNKLRATQNYSLIPWSDIDYSIVIAAFSCIDHSSDLSEFMQKIFMLCLDCPYSLEIR